MSTEEPAWKRDLFRTLYGRVAVDAIPDLINLVEPHIKAAEQRGRHQALCAVDAEIDALLGAMPSLWAPQTWKAGYEAGLTVIAVTIDSVMPEFE